MRKDQINFLKPLRFVMYARVSSDKQNPRSPDQQFENILKKVKALQRPWICVGQYRDDGISGRHTDRRPSFQRMQRDLKSGKVRADLILVDTFERLSRSEDGMIFRWQLEQIGVWVLTTDTQFADPRGLTGKLTSVFESYRASDESRVKGLNVRRGKLDAIQLKYWAGGPVPFGCRLKEVGREKRGAREVIHHRLEPDPATAWIVEKLFRLAADKGMAGGRLANELNQDPSIPDQFKPFNGNTIDRQLQNSLYYGDLIWDKVSTSIEKHGRTVDRRDPGDWTHIPDFCPGIVSKELWDQANSLRTHRSRKFRPGKTSKNSTPQNEFQPRGLALKYPLTGLLTCEHCGRSMVPTGAPAYRVKSTGEVNRYIGYCCPGHTGGACPNNKRIPEKWLRSVVFDLVRTRLFPGLESLTVDQLKDAEWFVTFCRQVADAMAALKVHEPDRCRVLEQEQSDLRASCEGWLESLGRKAISDSVRDALEAKYADAKKRLDEIEAQIHEIKFLSEQLQQELAPEVVFERLRSLEQVLTSENASRANLLLSQHIDCISCNIDGRVVIRTCVLGALSGALDLISEPNNPPEPMPQNGVRETFRATRRKRTHLRVDATDEEDSEHTALQLFASDPNRFAGFDDTWFREDVFIVPDPAPSWTASHAIEIAQFRLEHRTTIAETAQHFKKCLETIKSAIKLAKQQGVDASDNIVQHDRKPCWAAIHADEVATFMSTPGRIQKDAAKAFGKSLPTIIKAMKFARERQAGLTASSETPDAT